MVPSLKEGSQNTDLGSHGMENIPCLYQTWCPFLAPRVLVLDVIRIIEFIAPGLVADDNYADTPSAQNARDDWTNAIGSAGAEVNRVGGGLWEVNGLGPVEGKCEDLFCDGPRDRGSRTPEIRS